MDRIPFEDTPIYTQLLQEQAAREAFVRHFVENPLPETYVFALDEYHSNLLESDD